MLPSLENITHPCFTDKHLDSCTNMFEIEKKGDNLSEDQFLLVACSLASLLKKLHEQHIYLGGVDEDHIQLKPIGAYYLPILQKKHMPYLKKSYDNQGKINDTRLLCKMLLKMNHVKCESINNLLIDAHDQKKDCTTLFEDLAQLVKAKIEKLPTDKYFKEVALQAGVECKDPQAMKIHAVNHQIDQLHGLESNSDENVSLEDLNEEERTSLYCAKPNLAERETNREIKTTAKVLHQNLWPSSASVTISPPPTLSFWGLIFNILWYYAYPPSEIMTTSSQEELHDNTAYLRAFNHLWDHARGKINDFLKNIPAEKLNVLMITACKNHDTDKIETLKSAYKNNEFTTFLEQFIAPDDKLVRDMLISHGMSAGDGKYFSTSVATTLIDLKKKNKSTPNNLWEDLLKIVNAIQEYNDQILTPRSQEQWLPSFRKHTNTQRQVLCNEVFQTCCEATNENKLAEKLQSQIKRLNDFSTFGKSALAQKLEVVHDTIISKSKQQHHSELSSRR